MLIQIGSMEQSFFLEFPFINYLTKGKCEHFQKTSDAVEMQGRFWDNN